jgi:hypothetical protein
MFGFLVHGNRAWENELVFRQNIWFLAAGQQSLGLRIGFSLLCMLLCMVLLVQGNRVWQNESVFCYNVWFVVAGQPSLGERMRKVNERKAQKRAQMTIGVEGAPAVDSEEKNRINYKKGMTSWSFDPTERMVSIPTNQEPLCN